MYSRKVLIGAFILAFLLSAQAQNQSHANAVAAKLLPGNGLAQHPFLYCGEWQNQSLDQQTMYVVRDGKVVWSYTNPKTGELGDCTMLSNGNIVFSRQFGASEVTRQKQLVWNYDAPQGTEVHTAYPTVKIRCSSCKTATRPSCWCCARVTIGSNRSWFCRRNPPIHMVSSATCVRPRAEPELQGRVTILDKDNVPVSFLGDNPLKDQWANYEVSPENIATSVFSAAHGCHIDADANI